MTPQQAAEFVPILQAFAAGETIQYRSRSDSAWKDQNDLSFYAYPENYRIKPKPETRVMTIADLPDGPIWVRHDKTDEIELVFKMTKEFIETAMWRIWLGTGDVTGYTWSTSHKGPWKPFTVEVEASV